jgi:hypothetical protein
MVATIIWGLNCLINNVDVIIIIIIIVTPLLAFKMSVPHKVVMIFQLERFVTIHLMGRRPSISKIPSLVSGHS